jgi:hypothetical protein
MESSLSKRDLSVFFFVSLFFLSSISATVSPVVAVARVIYILGSKYGISDSHELQVDQAVANYIAQCANAIGYANLPWYPATKDDYMYAAWGGSYDQALVWTIGHGFYDPGPYPQPVENRLRYYIFSNDNYQVLDSWIHSYTTRRIDRFVFMWHCYQGDKIWVSSSYGEHGMPWAWLYTKDLSSNGYKTPDNHGYVLIGFYNEAPFLSNTMGGVNEAGRIFVESFYYAIFNLGKKVNDALDYAAAQTWTGVSTFQQCIFYTGYSAPSGTAYVKVYGDGNYHPT